MELRKNMRVNILISTLNEGIDRVGNVLLDPRDDVKYIISQQYTDERFKYVPDGLIRPDVIISQIASKGVTKSRNNAIRLAEGDIGLFSDDDVKYQHSDIDLLKETFNQNENLDVAIFKIRTPPGEPEYKKWPDEIIEYKKAPFVGTVQIAFRVARVKEKKVFFDERFGAGQELLVSVGERIFVHDCLQAGLKVVYYPKYIVEHPYMSKSKGIPLYDRRRNWVVGGMDCRINGPIALPKSLVGTLRLMPDLLRHRVNPARYFYQRLSAAIYVLKTNKKIFEKLREQQ